MGYKQRLDLPVQLGIVDRQLREIRSTVACVETQGVFHFFRHFLPALRSHALSFLLSLDATRREQRSSLARPWPRTHPAPAKFPQSTDRQKTATPQCGSGVR